MKSCQKHLGRIRLLIAIVIVGLVGSGLSALALLRESVALDYWVHALACPSLVIEWIERVHIGLQDSYAMYPFIAYGTDWLAFGHFVIAFFVVGALIDPVKNIWIVQAAMIACPLVVPTALFCGAMRGIPLWWRAIDCSFGVGGFVPLFVAGRMIRKLDQS